MLDGTMKHLKLKLVTVQIALGLFANSAYADNTVTLSGLESGPTVHGLSAKNQHTTQSTADDLIVAAARDDAMIMLSITTTHDVERAKPIVKAAMDKHLDVLIEGTDELITQLKPVNQSVWVPGNRLFISTRSENLGTYVLTFDRAATVDQIDSQLTLTRKQIAAQAARDKPLSVATAARSVTTPSNKASGGFSMPSILAPTPSAVCLSIRNELASHLAGSDMPESEITNAVQRVCQYGTVGEYRASPAEAGTWGEVPSKSLVLNLRTEWMLLLSEDSMQPQGSRAYLWLRTLGDDAGSGFTWTNGVTGHAYASKKDAAFYTIMKPLIHTGWGPIERRTHWSGSPEAMFLCEKNPTATGPASNWSNSQKVLCPVRPQLLSLLPGNSHDDKVNVAQSTGWSIGAGVQGGVSEGKPSLSLSLSGGYSSTQTSEVTLSMVRTSTNADTTMYRTTTWIPGWQAMFNWIRAMGLKQGQLVDLSPATPLATTLNPSHSVVWQLPLTENAGRTTMYTSAYEAGDHQCHWVDKHSRCEPEVREAAGVWTSNNSLLVTLPSTK
jgi:hypothetical protein